VLCVATKVAMVEQGLRSDVPEGAASGNMELHVVRWVIGARAENFSDRRVYLGGVEWQPTLKVACAARTRKIHGTAWHPKAVRLALSTHREPVSPTNLQNTPCPRSGACVTHGGVAMKNHHALVAALLTLLVAGAARADDTPSPCRAIKRIVAAAPDGFQSFAGEGASTSEALILSSGQTPADCRVAGHALVCTWTSGGGLESFAADLAACLPEATHDLNTPSRQHFTVGPKGQRTSLTASTLGDTRLKLEVGRGK
jgi:hypothetical protein